MEYKLTYKLRNKEYIIKSNDKIELVNKLLAIMKLTETKIHYILYQYQFNYNIGEYIYKQIAGYSTINY